MTSHSKRRRKSQRYRTTSTLVLGRRQARATQTSRALRRVRTGVVAVLVVVAGLSAWLLADDRFYVRGVDVVGTVRILPNDVFWASDLPGLHVLWVNAEEIEASILRTLPALESVEVKCRLPPECTITVVERLPRMTWDDGVETWWLDTNGVLFHARGALAEGWQIRGPLPWDDQERLQEDARVALTDLWSSGVEMAPVLEYRQDRGFVITDARGWRVFVGQGEGIEERLQVLDRMAADLQARGVTPRFVDVRLCDVPYYSLVNAE